MFQPPKKSDRDSLQGSVMFNYPKGRGQHAKTMIFALTQVSYYFPYSFVRGVWDELNATGNIGLIRDERIRDRLIEFYQGMEFALDLEEEKQTYYLTFRENMRGAIDPYSVLEVLDHPLSFGGFELNTPLPDINELIERLKEIPKLSGIVADIILARDHGVEEANSLKEQATQILELVDENLGIGN